MHDLKYSELQQCLPFTVLKHCLAASLPANFLYLVATVLTVYGIETLYHQSLVDDWLQLQQCLPFTVLKPISFHIKPINSIVATVLTVYGIETHINDIDNRLRFFNVATVLTVYGIETHLKLLPVYSACEGCNSAYRLRY